MGVVFTNNAETTLAAAISSTSATSISVTSSSTFPTVGAGEYFYATVTDGTNLEIVKITAVSGTTWTVVRASDNTTARTFANGSTVQLRTTAALLTDIQENIASKSANQTVYNATAASSATAYDVGINPGVEANAMVFLDGVMQHHDTFSFSGSTLTFDAAPTNGTKIEVIVDNLINLQSSNLTVDTFTATSNQTAFTLSDSPAAEANLIVFINGVFQNQAAYTISNNTLTLDTGVVTGRTVTVYVINPVNIGTPSDGTVTSAKLSGNITTPGTLTVGSHDVAFDSPTFVVDNSNSRVGLGTASPSVPVDIVGDVKMSANLTVDTTTLVVDSSNNKVGIGETSPQGILHVKSADSGATADGGADELVVEGSANTGISILSGASSSGSIYFGDSGSAYDGYIQYDQTNRKFNFVTATSGGMTIDASNKVGIGETSPANNLHIGIDSGGEGILVKSTGDHSAMLQFNVNRGNGNRAIAQLNGLWNGTSVADIQLKTGGDTTNKDDGEITFHTSSADNIAERMRIDSSGNVGIGTTSPSATDWGSASPVLQLSGTQPLLSLKDTDTGEWQIANSGQTLYFWSTTTDKQYTFPATGGRINMTDANGNVAIGHEALNVIAANSGDSCTAMGYQALEKVTDGIHNTGVGYRTGMEITTGSKNVLMGNFAGDAVTTASQNTCIGYGAGSAIVDGSNNIMFGYNAEVSASGRSELVIATAETGKGDGTGFIAPPGNGNMFQGNNSSSWATTSDIRIKKNIVDNNIGLEKINQIQVKNFEYKTAEEITELPTHTAIKKEGLQLGVIAQEVEDILPDIVKTEDTGCKTVNPDNITWYLVNAVQELSTQVQELKAKLESE